MRKKDNLSFFLSSLAIPLHPSCGTSETPGEEGQSTVNQQSLIEETSHVLDFFRAGLM